MKNPRDQLSKAIKFCTFDCIFFQKMILEKILERTKIFNMLPQQDFLSSVHLMASLGGGSNVIGSQGALWIPWKNWSQKQGSQELNLHQPGLAAIKVVKTPRNALGRMPKVPFIPKWGVALKVRGMTAEIWPIYWTAYYSYQSKLFQTQQRPERLFMAPAQLS